MADGLWRYFSVRKTTWAIAGCGLLAAAGLAAAPPRVELDGNPAPSAGQVQAAQNTVTQRAVALGQQEERLAAAHAELTDLETQAEILTENYDKTVVEEQQAAMAYSTAAKKLAGAQSTEESSQREVANLAATEYETQGFDPMAAMLGDARGVQAYLNQVGLGQEFATRSTDILASNNADSVVAGVFRSEASAALKARKADVRQAAALKTAIEAAVTRQLAAVKTTKSATSQLSRLLQSAKITEQSLASQREAVLAAQAAAAGQDTAPVASSPGQAISFPDSPASSQQGNVAADWALSQIGRPYQWGGAGSYTYDCSGLTMVAWAQAGVFLLHYTGYQWEEGVHVPLDDLQRGDLLFYATDNSDPATIHHVGIYIGGGDMVDAPYTGVDVRIDSIYQPTVPIGAVRP
jgi:cell wall-associated NlpC family hydrolase